MKELLVVKEAHKKTSDYLKSSFTNRRYLDDLSSSLIEIVTVAKTEYLTVEYYKKQRKFKLSTTYSNVEISDRVFEDIKRLKEIVNEVNFIKKYKLVAKIVIALALEILLLIFIFTVIYMLKIPFYIKCSLICFMGIVIIIICKIKCTGYCNRKLMY